MRSALFFSPSGPMLARVSTYPDGLDVPDHHDDPAAQAETDRRWLTQIWARPDVRAALRLASPSLAGRLDIVTCETASAEQLRRLTRAVASYLVRWHRRPTPFGLFAGITPANIGPAAALRFGPDHRVAIRADGQWLAALVDRLESHPELLARLPVVVNNSCFVRGDRVAITDRPSAGRPGPLTEVSIRHTRPVQLALKAASASVTFGCLAEQLHAAFPASTRATITDMLASLVAQGFLLTALRPPSTVVDGLPHVISHLHAAGNDLADIADLLQDLEDIQHQLTRPPAGDPLAHADMATVADRMISACGGTDTVLAADTAVDGRISLPRTVFDEAAAAASVLLRLTTRPFGPEVWRDYHLAFRALYGPGALVPVRELIADSGLGFPADFIGAARGRPVRPLSGRDSVLLALIQQAMVDGRAEITLTEPLIQDLTVGNPGEMVVPQRAELPFHLEAASADAVTRGAFVLWVTGAPRTSSSMAGRFAHLLPPQERELLAASFAPDGEAVAAQLSFPPRRRHNENVVRVPRLLPAVIHLAEHPTTGTVPINVDDLAVTADATQMYLVQISTRRRIVPWALHALEASAHTPPLARFLAGVPCARHAVYGLFDWGAARKLPHLPRLRYGRTVLAPARWILTASDLGTRRDSTQRWDKHLAAWRDRWRVPSWVVLYQEEARLPLDLDARLDRSLLRTRLERAGQVELREHPREDWAGRACEFLATLTAAPSAHSGPAPPAVMERPTAMLMPGAGDVVHAQLSGHPARYDEILTSHLPRLLQALDLERWWFRRHRDTLRPDSLQQLWLYLQLSGPDQYAAAAARLADFAARLQTQGLLARLRLAAYQPQTGRYGPGTALATSHRVAAADSAAALAQITMASRSGLPDQAIAAASMADLAAGLASSSGDGYGWLVNQLPREYGELDRTLRDTSRLLAEPANGYRALREHAGGEEVARAWTVRRATLNVYSAQLSRHRHAPITVLRSLLHDHHVRALGVDPDVESVTNRLARAAALRVLARAEQDQR
ncbi:thiopeptide-type bacteriocin biosynthesis protein [Nonomuraea thailandensis]|uniref:Thiopeptide-type bacteriocin biosynthesis protein n=1 Tax=Nonomuraea thailandensis TaxID=1188745 RepID=A0A9X2GIW2_9ACTN|nr:lantibiotic dehydratase [Nonomuraea thailandensis]MCP2359706.1 thiopeptide-type bacteriocin biosynthesis protein [Nonomuraea thailandensis]